MKLPQSFYNWTSFIGAVIAIVSLFMIGFLFVISIFFAEGSSYLGLFLWIVLPTFLVLGLIIIPAGMIIQHGKDRKKKIVYEKAWPKVDLNDPRTRNAAVIFGVGSVFFLLLSAVGSYEAFHYTESVKFCGTLCHEVMKPEYVAYQNSSHARVACVECHVGSGADWYVRSKLSGLYQVYAVTLGTYPKPIPTPIMNLRPARETCEECHWPQKFYARQLVVEKHYLSDQNNTEWDIHLQMKTGPAYSALGLQEGIHWHINPDVKIEYVATENTRQSIPWVRYTNSKSGEVYTYYDEENTITQQQLDSLEVRIMDCMDCHNRPSHDYQTPGEFINNALTAGHIPKELPDIKSLAMTVLSGINFSTTDSALNYIQTEVLNYYQSGYEDLFRNNKATIEKAIAGIQEAFRKNVFPEMNVKWSAYQNNIGHLEFMGCFRCHNDRHQDKSGRIISRDCNLCHAIVAQGVPDTLQVTSVNSMLEFVHPDDPDKVWQTEFCSDCHADLY